MTMNSKVNGVDRDKLKEGGITVKDESEGTSWSV